MKKFIRKIWDAFVTLVNKVPKDKLLHFVMGLLIAAFCALVLNWGPWCILPAIALGAVRLVDHQGRGVVGFWSHLHRRPHHPGLRADLNCAGTPPCWI